MDDYQLTWFTDEILLQCAAGLMSYNHMVNLVDNRETRQSREAWIAITSFLSHTGLVAQFVSGAGGSEGAAKRRRELREHLEIADTSPILSRQGRNSLQHFDERMDNWMAGEKRSILEMVFEDRQGYDYFVDPRRHAIRRVLIADERVFVVEDAEGKAFEVPLPPMADEVAKLAHRCERNLRARPYYVRP